MLSGRPSGDGRLPEPEAGAPSKCDCSALAPSGDPLSFCHRGFQPHLQCALGKETCPLLPVCTQACPLTCLCCPCKPALLPIPPPCAPASGAQLSSRLRA